MSPGRRPPAARALLAAAVAAVLPAAACGDGTPAFCSPLAEVSDLDALAAALDRGDLDGAGAEARRLQALAGDAPSEIRADFRALADAVVDIVGLLENDERVAAGDADGAAGPATVERTREELNERLGELDRRSLRVATWASRECGLDLG